MAWTAMITKVKDDSLVLQDVNIIKGNLEYLKAQTEVVVDAAATEPNSNGVWGNLAFWALQNTD